MWTFEHIRLGPFPIHMDRGTGLGKYPNVGPTLPMEKGTCVPFDKYSTGAQTPLCGTGVRYPMYGAGMRYPMVDKGVCEPLSISQWGSATLEKAFEHIPMGIRYPAEKGM